MLTSWLTGNTLTATSAPTASYFTATSSNATSTFPRLSVSSGVSLMGEYFENFTNYTRSLFTAGNGLSLSSGQYSVNSSELSNNSLVSWNGSNFVATGTPQLTVGTILATSTTATSTFSGNIRVAGNAQVDGSLFAPITFTAGTVSLTSLSLANPLTVPNGGTGAITHTLGNVLVGNGTSAITSTTTANLKTTLAFKQCGKYRPLHLGRFNEFNNAWNNRNGGMERNDRRGQQRRNRTNFLWSRGG